MAQKRSIHNMLERSALPLFIVILVPICAIAYAAWSSSSTSSTAEQSSAPTQTAPTTTPAAITLNNTSSLPQSVSAAQLVPFSFTIQNIGNASGTIPYKVYVKWSTGEEDVIDENAVPLPGGMSVAIPEQLKFEVATETAEVYLELTQTGQTTQFALPRT